VDGGATRVDLGERHRQQNLTARGGRFHFEVTNLRLGPIHPKIAHHAADNDLTLKQAALELGFVSAAEFDRVVDPAKMVKPYVAAAS